jgi:hypothetical protein
LNTMSNRQMCSRLHHQLNGRLAAPETVQVPLVAGIYELSQCLPVCAG